MNYKGNTPETVGKGASYIYSLNGVTDGGTVVPPTPIEHDGLTLETAFTASEANAWIMANIEGNNNTGDTKYYVKGKIQRFYQRLPSSSPTTAPRTRKRSSKHTRLTT